MILSSVREVLWKRSVGVLKINKRTPPPEFVEAAAKAKETYSLSQPGKQTPYEMLETEAKDVLREALAAEQGYLCVYCMSRISDSEQDMKIEHLYPRHDEMGEGAKLSVEYTNLFASCNGGEGEDKELQTCDTHKGNAIISVNPLDSDSIAKISYSYDGKVKSNDSDIEHDLNDTLNLNVEKLKRNRQEAWRCMRDRIARKNLSSQIKAYDTFIEEQGQIDSNKKMEYAGFLLFMSRKELRKLRGKQKGLQNKR